MLQLGNNAAWAPIAVYFLHSVLAEQWGHEPYVDPIIHFFGGIAITFFFWRSAKYCQRFLGDFSLFTLAYIAFGFGFLTALAWEFMEYVIMVSENAEILWSLSNTLRDLFLGMAGAALFSGTKLWSALRSRRVIEK